MCSQGELKGQLEILSPHSQALQADYLLVYTFNSDIYYDYKAFATCEAILLDTRTGMISYSTIITKEVLSQKT